MLLFQSSTRNCLINWYLQITFYTFEMYLTLKYFLRQLHRNRTERKKTGGGQADPDTELTEIEDMFLDYVGVEGVVGELLLHTNESVTKMLVYVHIHASLIIMEICTEMLIVIL